MNQAAFHLKNRKELQKAAEKERFLKAEREWDKEVINEKNGIFQASSPSFGGRQGSIRLITSLVLARKFPTG